MAEPIPSARDAGDAAKDESKSTLPKNAEDRKAAEALDSLNANTMSQERGESSTKSPSAADQDALGRAMSRLEIASGVSKKKGDTSGKVDTKKEAEIKKKIKVASEDVNMLVAELDLSKTKATDLLRTHDGDIDKAIRAFIAPATKA